MARLENSLYNGSIAPEGQMGPNGTGLLTETGANRMSEFKLRVGSFSARGVRSNNEDNFVVDLRQRLFVVADGMGGQDRGEVASSMAVEIIPPVIPAHRAVNE